MVGAVSADIVKPKPQSVGIALPAVIGKLPAHGDFIARGIAHRDRDVLDRWMASWIEKARAELNDAFDDTYLSAPPWLFESAQITAVLIPSVDAVGRRFPVLALASPQVRTQAVYDALVAALEEGQTGDDFCAGFASLESGDSIAETDRLGEWFLPEGAATQLLSPADADGWSDVKGLLT